MVSCHCRPSTWPVVRRTFPPLDHYQFPQLSPISINPSSLPLAYCITSPFALKAFFDSIIDYLTCSISPPLSDKVDDDQVASFVCLFVRLFVVVQSWTLQFNFYTFSAHIKKEKSLTGVVVVGECSLSTTDRLLKSVHQGNLIF